MPTIRRPNRQSPPLDRLPKGAGWQTVYAVLREEIVSLQLPPGDPLDETVLAERFNLSRSPIREALIRLAGDELVVLLPNRSTFVAPVDIRSFPRYVEALDITQRMVTRLAAEQKTPADLEAIAARQREFEASLKQRDPLAITEANKNFHMAIAQASCNPYLIGFYERLLTQGRRMLHMQFEYPKKPAHNHLITDEHDHILLAIERGDVERADRLAHAHTHRFRDQFIEFMNENLVTSLSLRTSHEISRQPRKE